MFTPETSHLFTKKADPQSGIEYYVLTERVAAFQQGFYFVNNSWTDDGHYLWFYASFPPVFSGSLRQLGVINFETDEIYLCNDTLFEHAAPYVDPKSGVCYFAWEGKLFKRGPEKEDHTELIMTVPTVGFPQIISTHLTFSPDGKEIFLNVWDGNTSYYTGVANIETKEFTKWADFPYMVNHGQFNPVDPDLALCAYDGHNDIITGEKCGIPTIDGVYQRLWTSERNGKITNYPPIINYATHEWWSADGKKIYYCNSAGICRYHMETREHIVVHPCHPWHAFSSKDESMYIFDEVVADRFNVWYRGCPAAVKFFNAKTGKQVNVVTRMSENEWTPEHMCNYHIDPHPRFTDNEKYVVFTTSDLGGADLAVVDVPQLLKATE